MPYERERGFTNSEQQKRREEQRREEWSEGENKETSRGEKTQKTKMCRKGREGKGREKTFLRVCVGITKRISQYNVPP